MGLEWAGDNPNTRVFVIVDDGSGGCLGITGAQWEQLLNTNEDERHLLRTQWRAERDDKARAN